MAQSPQNLVIGIDMDGCIYRFVAALQLWVHRTTGTPLTELPAATCWDFYKDQWGLSTAEFLSHYADSINAGHMFLHGEPEPGALETLYSLKAQGHEIVIITDRRVAGAEEAAEKNTRQWLERWSIPYDQLVFSPDKTVVRTDLFLEDRPENYDALCRSGSLGVMFDQAWNAEHPASTRVFGWKEFGALVASRAAELAA